MIQVPEYFFIGSKNRLLFPVGKIIEGGTLFVEPQEYDDYSLLYQGQFKVVKLREDNAGFGYLLKSMNEYAIRRKFPRYFFCDDDVLKFSFRNKGSDLLKELKIMEKWMVEKNYSQVMMSFQGHNWYYEKTLKEKIGAWCVVLNNTTHIKTVGVDTSLPIFNDWDVSAKLIKAGFKTACYYGAMFDHKMKSLEGGADFIYRKQLLLDTAAEILKKRYGEKAIKIVWAHNQNEVRFQWRYL